MTEIKKEELGWVSIDIDELVPADWNYKIEDEEKAKKLAANIKRNGQIENILVRRLQNGKNEVVNGNHRLISFRETGMKEVVCFQLGAISKSAAKRIAIETNETKFDTNYTKLAELFRDMVTGADAEFEIKDLAETLPFDESQIENYVSLLDFDWDAFQNKNNTDDEKEGSDNKKEITCPECGHAFKIE